MIFTQAMSPLNLSKRAIANDELDKQVAGFKFVQNDNHVSLPTTEGEILINDKFPALWLERETFQVLSTVYNTNII